MDYIQIRADLIRAMRKTISEDSKVAEILNGRKIIDLDKTAEGIIDAVYGALTEIYKLDTNK